MKQIVRNAVRCAHCGTEIESTHRHDFVTHECLTVRGHAVSIAVDGGHAYLRRIGEPNDMIEISEWSGDEDERGS